MTAVEQQVGVPIETSQVAEVSVPASVNAPKEFDIWDGRPPENERLKQAFNEFSSNPRAMAIIKEFIVLGRQIHDESLGEGRPTPQAFEELVDKYDGRPDGKFLFQEHPQLAANTIAVVRWAAGPNILGSKEVAVRNVGRNVSDKSGKR